MSTNPPNVPDTTAARQTGSQRARRLGQRFAWLVRWLHIYLSMLAFATLVFFSVTGLTLNHPDWLFGTAERSTQAEGELDLAWLNQGNDSTSESAVQVARLEIVEHLRSRHELRGAVGEFRVDDYECMVTFQGPGYSAAAFIDRETGHYELNETYQGGVAVINDLHKGRHAGGAWSLVIDVSAVLLTLAGLTGLVLLFYIKRRRASGLATALVGGVALVAVFLWFVP